MNKLVNILATITIIINACSMNKIKPPVADKKPKELTIHNHTRIDNYYWLNDRENPDVIDYLEKENKYTRSILKDTEQLQDTLFNEIIARIKQTDMSVPYFKNGYYYYVRYEEGKEYAVHCRKKESLEAKEEIILDVNKMAEGFEYFNLASYSISPDNKIVAYGVDTLSRRIYTLYFKNLETGEVFEDKIENTTGRAVWANDNATTFYSLKDEQTLRSSQVLSYKLGGDKGSKLIFDPAMSKDFPL
ncbi:MAG: hypothetical protein MI922_26805 [Bacteroidales bacterium]|nr:hypothetical protein [Bacteroidales bacterium]